MVAGQQFHELLELVLPFFIGRRQQFLDQLEHRHDMPLLRFAEFRYQENGRAQEPLRRVIEIGILPIVCRIASRHDDGLGDDLGILLRFGLVEQSIRIGLV